MTAERIEVEAGPVSVWHRLALGVRCLDARTGAPVPVPVLVRRELGGPSLSLEPLVRTGTGCTLRYGASVGSRVVLRIEDPRRRWLPRRLAVRPPARGRAEASEAIPPGVYLGAADRTVEAWLYPGPAYPLPAGSTGARLRVLRRGAPVAWPRLEVFEPGGVPAGWAHGDEHGDVLVLTSTTGTIPPPAPATFPVVVRVHHPDPARPTGQGPPDPFQVPDTPEAPRPGDRLSTLVAERVTPPAGPTLPEGLDLDAAHGTGVPPGYVTAADVVVPLTTGQVLTVPVSV
ncbi:MAG TPA: hypothetical protein VHK02_05050 [Actinomycetota bacterium]|jgi:hypothetical protein|nr:hypothetical protein [Actinomycetota bacterium]